jgi:4-hydroxy-L-threonine phosphate dehydrogenase PdxA
MPVVKLAVTPGDPAGIGPEVVWKSIRANHAKWRKTPLLCVGARAPFDLLGARVLLADPENLSPPKEKRPHVWLLEAPVSSDPEVLLEGYQAGWSIETATALVLSGECAALITGPIHKERLNRGGYAYSGHTDFLAALCSEKEPLDVTMMLANDTLRVSLVTIHCSLASVPKNLTR